VEKDDIQKIEDYLLDNMTSEEKDVFDKRLGSEPDLKQEFEVMKSIFQSAEMSGMEKMKMNFEDIHKRNFESSKQTSAKTISINKMLKWAAIALLLIIPSMTLWILNLQNNDITQDELYATYFEPTELELTYRGDESNKTLQNLQELFNAKDYQNFITQLDSYDSSGSDLAVLTLAKGQANLELNNFASAEENFKALLDNPLFADQANWYLGLTYVKQKKTKEALEYLNSINKDTKYGKLALELIDNLE